MITQIPCPPQVTLAVHEDTQSFHIEGPLGSICMHLPTIDPMGFSFLKCTPTQIHLCPTSQTSRAHAQVSTLHSLILQGIEGVTKGWIVSLHLVGVGFRAEKKGDAIDLKLGQSHEILFPIPSDVHILCNDSQLNIYGVEKGRVTQVAASIHAFKPAEVYKGKGIRYATETLRLKEGKKK